MRDRAYRWAGIALLTWAVLVPSRTVLAQGVRPASVQAVESVGFTVSDMDRAVAFYTEVLTFEKIGDVEVTGEGFDRLNGVFGARLRVVRLRLGDETIALTEFITPRGRPIPATVKSNDRSFQHIAIIVRDMAEAYARLRDHKVAHVSSGPQRLPEWNERAANIEAFYFKDPDGHVLEVLAFPPDKGRAKWHRQTGSVFLGIDHTAIVVKDTDASLAFYRDLLGLEVAGESFNHGPEQERLNAVFGARLHITTLTPPEGPAVEFLEYITPSDGADMPSDTRPNDIWHWQTSMRVADVTEMVEATRRADYQLVSGHTVTFPNARLGFTAASLIRDPDGHAVLIMAQ